MKLHPPKVKMPNEDPFKYDIFNRKEFSKSLTSVLKNIQESSVICVDAPWGEGKTTFCEMWIKDLKNQEHVDVIYYDAYQHDYSEDPFLSFVGEILSASKIILDLNENQNIVKEFQDLAISVGKKFLPILAKTTIKALITKVLGETGADDIIKAAKETLIDDSSELFSDIIKDQLNEYEKEKESVNNFKQKLSELGTKIRSEQGVPLTIIIDELDRCRPDFALTLIERIKHLFMVDNVSFVLFTNLHQLKLYVENVYGQGIDAHNYLQKFFTISTYLPLKNISGNNNDIKNFISYLSNSYDIVRYKEDFDYILEAYIIHYKLSLRSIEKIFSVFSLYFASTPVDKQNSLGLVAFLIIVKVNDSQLFSRLEANSISYEELESILIPEPTISNIKTFQDTIQGLLIEEGEYAQQINDNIKRTIDLYCTNFRLNRKRTIPILCKQINNFQISENI